MSRELDLIDNFAKRFPSDFYLRYHAPRYRELMRALTSFVKEDAKVLDVGRSRLTSLLEEQLQCKVDTLGFEGDSEVGGRHHFQFDLNNAQSSTYWRTDLPLYDVVILAEVIEHLYTAPSLVLNFLG
jgi:hypothetical protein